MTYYTKTNSRLPAVLGTLTATALIGLMPIAGHAQDSGSQSNCKKNIFGYDEVCLDGYTWEQVETPETCRRDASRNDEWCTYGYHWSELERPEDTRQSMQRELEKHDLDAILNQQAPARELMREGSTTRAMIEDHRDLLGKLVEENNRDDAKWPKALTQSGFNPDNTGDALKQLASTEPSRLRVQEREAQIASEQAILEEQEKIVNFRVYMENKRDGVPEDDYDAELEEEILANRGYNEEDRVVDFDKYGGLPCVEGDIGMDCGSAQSDEQIDPENFDASADELAEAGEDEDSQNTDVEEYDMDSDSGSDADSADGDYGDGADGASESDEYEDGSNEGSDDIDQADDGSDDGTYDDGSDGGDLDSADGGSDEGSYENGSEDGFENGGPDGEYEEGSNDGYDSEGYEDGSDGESYEDGYDSEGYEEGYDGEGYEEGSDGRFDETTGGDNEAYDPQGYGSDGEGDPSDMSLEDMRDWASEGDGGIEVIGEEEYFDEIWEEEVAANYARNPGCQPAANGVWFCSEPETTDFRPDDGPLGPTPTFGGTDAQRFWGDSTAEPEYGEIAGCSQADAERFVGQAQNSLGPQPSGVGDSANYVLKFMQVSREATRRFHSRCQRSDMREAVQWWDNEINKHRAWMRAAGITVKF